MAKTDLTDADIARLAEAVCARERKATEEILRLIAPDYIVSALRHLLHTEPSVKATFRIVVAEEARELLREWRAAHPAGSVISRTAVRDALIAAQLDGGEATGFIGADDAALERACASLRKSGYFIV